VYTFFGVSSCETWCPLRLNFEGVTLVEVFLTKFVIPPCQIANDPKLYYVLLFLQDFLRMLEMLLVPAAIFCVYVSDGETKSARMMER
jgi:hypothetical protein